MPLNTQAADPVVHPRLQTIAQSSLEQNIFKLDSGSYLAAGSHQFKSLWSRDFCFASRGLRAIGRNDVIKGQLSLMLDRIRAEDGLVPRYMGSASHFLRKLGYAFHFAIPLHEPLDSEYDAGAGGEGQAIDSNALVILTVLDYVESSGDQAFWIKYYDKIRQVFRFYEKHKDPVDGLIVQGPFADWQDSVSRDGKTFFVNLLYYAASERLSKYPDFGITQTQLDARRKVLVSTFLEPVSGLYMSIAGHPDYISLDGNLLAIDLGFHAPSSEEAKKLYANLKRHPLWASRDLPGFNTSKRYPIGWIGGLAKLVNVADYHDDMYWSWLMGLSAKIAGRMGDATERDRIFFGIETLALRDAGITEVYEPAGEHLPVSRVVNFPVLSWLGYRVYAAEKPFSWGAGIILDALKNSAPDASKPPSP